MQQPQYRLCFTNFSKYIKTNRNIFLHRNVPLEIELTQTQDHMAMQVESLPRWKQEQTAFGSIPLLLQGSPCSATDTTLEHAKLCCHHEKDCCDYGS